MIARTTVDAVFDAARVEEVIGDFVQLKKSGSNFKGLSPFSDERTPSFMVSPVKQIWKDFSSGKGGNAVTFIMEHEHFTFPEAIKYLANKYGIEVEETEQTDEQKQMQDEKESMFLVSKFAAEWFAGQLKTEEGRAIGYSYFKERGFSDETIKYFELGYSPDQWDAFTNAAVKAGYKLDFLEKTGLTIIKDDKQFDRFKGRVMFPIRSMSGRVLGFGGRILDSSKKAAKYLNSPQSEIYDKSKVLYGIYEAKQAMAKEDLCYLVEGYTDVIQLYQAGIQNVVSSSGTALTTEQIRLISRLTKNITVLYDGDAAGLRAAIRGIDLILEAGMNVRVCTFPEGEDPDSFAKSHTESEIRTFLKDHAVDFIRFKSGLLKDEAAGDPIKKAGMIREIVQSISKIPDEISREVYVQESAAILDIGEDVLFSTLAQMRNAEVNETRKKNRREQESQTMQKVPNAPAASVIDRREVLERNIIRILLLYGERDEEFIEEYIQEPDGNMIEVIKKKESKPVYEKIFLDLQEDEVEFSNAYFKNLYPKLIDIFLMQGKIDVNTVMSELEDQEAQLIADLIMDEDRYQLSRWEEKQIFVKQKDDTVATYVTDTILNFRRLMIAEKVKALYTDLKSSVEEDNVEALTSVIDYNKLNQHLGKRLNRVI
ncbi:DNA primase [Nonlabens sp. Hel1_33_55]|uniref:DNA primase n=1 Tax=Nonlabens sp. Hel1_33_55 TaxID=1336802 RepID=UPI000875CC70|nr:DNA primase [Nonlabens sp. Hel1_33_55]SCY24316.1 DNA primase [Nonlabens sp. Hel1_33_55]